MAVYSSPNGPVITSGTSLNTFTNFDSPLQLVWPMQLYPTDNNVCTTMLFSNDIVNSEVYLPNAEESGMGSSFIMNNVGSRDINIYSFDGVSNNFTLNSGESRIVVLTDNTSETGQWINIVLGATSTPADAGDLAGYGLVALPVIGGGTDLNTEFAVTPQSANFTITSSMRAQLLLINPGTSVVTVNSNLIDGFFCLIYNNTSGLVNFNCIGDATINGEDSLALLSAHSFILVCDGNGNYTTIGLETTTATSTTLIEVEIVSGTTNLELSADQLSNNIIAFIGDALTANCAIYLGAPENNQWIFQNRLTVNTDGFELSIQLGENGSPLGTTYVLPANQALSMFADAASSDLYVESALYPLPANSYVPLVSQAGNLPPAYGGIVLSYIDINFSSSEITLPENVTTIINQSVVSFSQSAALGGNSVSSRVFFEGNFTVKPSYINSTDLTSLSLVKSSSSTGPWTGTITSQGTTQIGKYAGSFSDANTAINVSFSAYDEVLPTDGDVYYAISAVCTCVGSSNGAINPGGTGTIYCKLTSVANPT